MVTILYRFSGDKGSYEDKLDGYKDAADIYHYAKNAVGWATEKGVVAGYPDGTFQPKGNATRAEAAKVLVIIATLTNRYRTKPFRTSHKRGRCFGSALLRGQQPSKLHSMHKIRMR